MNFKFPIYIVTCCDRGESCDYKPQVLGVFKTKDEAETYVKNDMDDRIEYAGGDEACEYDYDKMTIDYDDDAGCSWNIEKIESFSK